MVMAEGVYARIVATPSVMLIAPLVDENVYAPLLSLTPVMTEANETLTSVP